MHEFQKISNSNTTIEGAIFVDRLEIISKYIRRWNFDFFLFFLLNQEIGAITEWIFHFKNYLINFFAHLMNFK